MSCVASLCYCNCNYGIYNAPLLLEAVALHNNYINRPVKLMH